MLDARRDTETGQLAGGGGDRRERGSEACPGGRALGSLLGGQPVPGIVVVEQAGKLPGQRRRAAIRDARRQHLGDRVLALERALEVGILARIRSQAPRSWSPSPAGRVWRSVGPASSDSSPRPCGVGGQR